MLSHLKGSELFETLLCESEGIIARFRTGRIDFRASLGFQGIRAKNAGIEEVRIRVFFRGH